MKVIRPLKITDAVLIGSNVAEADYPAYVAGTVYGLATRCVVITAGVHNVYESLQAANVGHDPTLVASATWWALVSKTNRWKMFDAYNASQTENAGSIAVTLVTTGRINALALLNISATTAHITMTDAVDGVVYDQTYSLIDLAGITTPYLWCFEPPRQISGLTLFDLPPYANTTISVTLTASSGLARCGDLVVGLSKYLGDTTWGMQLGIDDYSVKERDAWGNTNVVERDFSREGKFVLRVDRTKFDALAKFLPTVRSDVMVWVASDYYTSTAIVGWFESFNLEIQGFAQHTCSLTIKGTT